MGEGQKRSLAERGNKSPGDESMELDQDGVEYDIPLKVEAIEEKVVVVPEVSTAAPSPPPSTVTAAAPVPTPKTRGRGGKSRGGGSRGRASAKRRGVRNSKAPQKEAEEEHDEEHGAEHVEEHVEGSHEVSLHVLCTGGILVDIAAPQNGTGASNEANPSGEEVASVKTNE